MTIRQIWLEYVLLFFRNQPDQSHELNKHLEKKLLDPEEKIRAAAIAVVHAIVREKDPEAVALFTVDLLKGIGSRCRDKKVCSPVLD